MLFCTATTSIEHNWLYKYTSKIYSIAIPSRLSNVKVLSEQLRSDINIVEAVLKGEHTIQEYIDTNIVAKNTSLTEGRVAVYLSHKKALQRFLNETEGLSENTRALILEDDSIILDNIFLYKEIFELYMENIPSDIDWDILKMDRCWDDCLKSKPVNRFYVQPYKATCTHGSYYTRKAAKIILEEMNRPAYQFWDRMLKDLYQAGKLSVIATNYNLFKQDQNLDHSLADSSKLAPICRVGDVQQTNPFLNYRELIPLFDKYKAKFETLETV